MSTEDSTALPDPEQPAARVIATADVEHIYQRMIELRAQADEIDTELELRKADLRRMYAAGQSVFSPTTGEEIFAFQEQREFDLKGAVAYLQAETPENLEGCTTTTYSAAKIKGRLTGDELARFMRAKPGTEAKVIVK